MTSQTSHIVAVSYIEIYNETIYDLLQNFNEHHTNNAASNSTDKFSIHRVNSMEEARDLLFEGDVQRVIREVCLILLLFLKLYEVYIYKMFFKGS